MEKVSLIAAGLVLIHCSASIGYYLGKRNARKQREKQTMTKAISIEYGIGPRVVDDICSIKEISKLL